MIEAQAKFKLCPFKLAGTIGDEHGYNCEGSGCMGWDVQDKIYQKPEGGKGGIWIDAPEPTGDCGMKPPIELNANF